MDRCLAIAIFYSYSLSVLVVVCLLLAYYATFDYSLYRFCFQSRISFFGISYL